MVKLKEILDVKNLEKRLEERYILKQVHPTLPLSIYNYSQEAMFDQVWDHETMICRGLIVDGEQNVISRPFYKFFNIDTSSRPETLRENLPKSTPLVTEKMDGSLGISWKYDGQTGIATRGSFTSEQAIWATKCLHNKYPSLLETIPEDSTLLFEIIYPENVIVVSYDFSDLIVLSMVYNPIGKEYSRKYLETLESYAGFPPLVPKFKKSLDQVIAENIHNKEGYVLSWEVSQDLHNAQPFRVKVKFADYMRLHKLVTGVSPKSLWKMLMAGIDLLALSEDLPEHFVTWVTEWTSKFREEYDRISTRSQAIYSMAPLGADRKTIALYFMQYPDYKSSLFLMLDHKSPSEAIWKHVWSIVQPRIKEDSVFRQDSEQT